MQSPPVPPEPFLDLLRPTTSPALTDYEPEEVFVNVFNIFLCVEEERGGGAVH